MQWRSSGWGWCLTEVLPDLLISLFLMLHVAPTSALFDFLSLTSLAGPIFSSVIDCPLTWKSVLQTKEKFGKLFLCDGENMEEDGLSVRKLGRFFSEMIL